jgi:hypothetical protein
VAGAGSRGVGAGGGWRQLHLRALLPRAQGRAGHGPEPARAARGRLRRRREPGAAPGRALQPAPPGPAAAHRRCRVPARVRRRVAHRLRRRARASVLAGELTVLVALLLVAVLLTY